MEQLMEQLVEAHHGTPSPKASPQMQARRILTQRGELKGGPARKVDLPEDMDFHWFVSHSQATGGDQCQSLCQSLETAGFIVWYDQTASDLTTEGMRAGIQRSQCCIIFLSDGVMGREFVQLELREAVRLEKPIVLVHEEDARHGRFDFAKEKAAAPDDLRFVFDRHESIPYRRRDWERRAMLTTIINRGGLAEAKERADIDRRAQAAVGMAVVPFEVPSKTAAYMAPVETEVRVKKMLMANRGWKIQIVGPAGSGKTSLAVSVVRSKEIRTHFSVILWVTVGQDSVVESLHESLGDQLQQLTSMQAHTHSFNKSDGQRPVNAGHKPVSSGTPMDQNHKALTAMCSALGQGQSHVLLIIDDCHDAMHEQYLNIVDEHSGGKVIVTTRMRTTFAGHATTTVQLEEMSADQAVALLMHAGQVYSHSGSSDLSVSEILRSLSDGERQAAETIAQNCGYLPYALRIAAQMIRLQGAAWSTSVPEKLSSETLVTMRGRGSLNDGHKEASEGAHQMSVQERCIEASLATIGSSSTKQLFIMMAVLPAYTPIPACIVDLVWEALAAPATHTRKERRSQHLFTDEMLETRSRLQQLIDCMLVQTDANTGGLYLNPIGLAYCRSQHANETLTDMHRLLVLQLLKRNEDEQIGYYIEAALPVHVCHLARAAGSVAAIIADPALMGCLESNDYLACGTTVRALYPLNVSLDPFGRNEEYSRRLLAGIALVKHEIGAPVEELSHFASDAIKMLDEQHMQACDEAAMVGEEKDEKEREDETYGGD
eukprot:g2075.t1